jgi:uncharacterized membrane protein
MVFVKPWDEKSRNILDRLTKDRIVYINDPVTPRIFGRKYPSLFDENNGFADIGFIKRRKESIFVLHSNVDIMPIHTKKSVSYRFFLKF